MTDVRLSDLVDPEKERELRALVADTPAPAAESKAAPAAPGIEHKADPGVGGAQVLSANDNTGVVEALVSVTGIEDRVKDVIEPGAYTKTLGKHEPIGVWSHNDKVWVARTEEAVELLPGDPFFRDLKTMDGQPWPANAGAVKVRARFNLDTNHGREAYSDVKFFQGKTGWSIGYRATKAHRNPRTGVRHIKELDWFEYSPVMVGAASQPMTLSTKGYGATVDPDEGIDLIDVDVLSAAEVKARAELRELLEVKATVRRVRTPAGAARYGQPIGAIIVRDVVPASQVRVGDVIDGKLGAVEVSGKVTANEADGPGQNITVQPDTGAARTVKVGADQKVEITRAQGEDTSPISNGQLQKLFGEADTDAQKEMIRAALKLPPADRRAFLAAGGKKPADGGGPPVKPGSNPGPGMATGADTTDGEPNSRSEAAGQRAGRTGNQLNRLGDLSDADLAELSGRYEEGSEPAKKVQAELDRRADDGPKPTSTHRGPKPGGAMDQIAAAAERARSVRPGPDGRASQLAVARADDEAAITAVMAGKTPDDDDFAVTEIPAVSDLAKRIKGTYKDKSELPSDSDFGPTSLQIAEDLDIALDGDDDAAMTLLMDRIDKATATTFPAGGGGSVADLEAEVARLRDKMTANDSPAAEAAWKRAANALGRAKMAEQNRQPTRAKQGNKPKIGDTVWVEGAGGEGRPAEIMEIDPEGSMTFIDHRNGRPFSAPASRVKPATGVGADARPAGEKPAAKPAGRAKDAIDTLALNDNRIASANDNDMDDWTDQLVDEGWDRAEARGVLNDLVADKQPGSRLAKDKAARAAAPKPAAAAKPGGDLSKMSDQTLDTMIDDNEVAGRTTSRNHAALLAERDRRKTSGGSGSSKPAAASKWPTDDDVDMIKRAAPTGADAGQRLALGWLSEEMAGNEHTNAEAAAKLRTIAKGNDKLLALADRLEGKTPAKMDLTPKQRSGGVPVEQVDGPRRDKMLSKLYADESDDDLATAIRQYQENADDDDPGTSFTERDKTILASYRDEVERRNKVKADARALVNEQRDLDTFTARYKQIEALLRAIGGQKGFDVAERAKLGAVNQRRRGKGLHPLGGLPAETKGLDLDATEFAADVADLEVKGSSASLDRSPKDNWVERSGGLPPYVREVARSIEKTGKPLSQAIQIAIGRIKRWAAGGGDVTAATQAKASKAVAEWEALKAKNGTKFDSELLTELEQKAMDLEDAVDDAYAVLYEAGEFKAQVGTSADYVQVDEATGAVLGTATVVALSADEIAKAAALRAALS